MAKSLYVSITESKSGKSLVSLGIMNLLMRKTSKVGYFRPFIGANAKSKDQDYHLKLIKEYFKLNLNYEEMYAYKKDEAQALLSRGHQDQVIEKIVSKFKALEEKCDFVLCEGTNFEDGTSAFEFDFNAIVAKNLLTPVLLVGKGRGRDNESIVSSMLMATEVFSERGCDVMGVLVNGHSLQPHSNLSND